MRSNAIYCFRWFWLMHLKWDLSVMDILDCIMGVLFETYRWTYLIPPEYTGEEIEKNGKNNETMNETEDCYEKYCFEEDETEIWRFEENRRHCEESRQSTLKRWRDWFLISMDGSRIRVPEWLAIQSQRAFLPFSHEDSAIKIINQLLTQQQMIEWEDI